MLEVLRSSRLTGRLDWLFLVVLLVACVPTEVEPSLSSGSTLQATASSGLPEATAELLPTPFPTPTTSPSPQVSLLVTPTSTAWDQGLPPAGTPTPVPPPPGLVYNLEGQLWQVGDDWQPVMLSAEGGDVISADGQRALRIVEGNVWLIALPGGQRFNLTGHSGRFHCCPQFWPTRPETIVFGSWPSADEVGPSTGHLSSVNVDLSEYRVLDEEHLSNANFAPGPDGQTIAYDQAGTSWLYDWEDGPRELDPAAFGLNDIIRIAGPSWSPDGRKLAWTVAVSDPAWRIAVAVFDLEAGSARLLHSYETIGRGGWFLPPEWSPDGRWLAYVAEDIDPGQYGVWVVEVEGSEEVFVGRGIHPRWSPDGRWLLINSAEGPYEDPWLVEVETWYPLTMHLPPGAQVVDWLP